MAIVFNALFGSNQSKTAGSSLTMDPTDITVAAGDDIFYAFASDDAGSAFAVSLVFGTASITWTLEKEQINAGNVKSQLWRGNVTAEGTVGRIDNNWTGSITAKAAVAGWFSGVGTQDGTVGENNSPGDAPFWRHTTVAAQAGDLIIGTGGLEGPNGDNVVPGGSPTGTEVAQDGTTGGSQPSNITVALIYAIPSSNTTSSDLLYADDLTSDRDAAGAGAVYSPPAAAAPSLIWQPAPARQYSL